LGWVGSKPANPNISSLKQWHGHAISSDEVDASADVHSHCSQLLGDVMSIQHCTPTVPESATRQSIGASPQESSHADSNNKQASRCHTSNEYSSTFTFSDQLPLKTKLNQASRVDNYQAQDDPMCHSHVPTFTFFSSPFLTFSSSSSLSNNLNNDTLHLSFATDSHVTLIHVPINCTHPSIAPMYPLIHPFIHFIGLSNHQRNNHTFTF